MTKYDPQPMIDAYTLYAPSNHHRRKAIIPTVKESDLPGYVHELRSSAAINNIDMLLAEVALVDVVKTEATTVDPEADGQ